MAVVKYYCPNCGKFNPFSAMNKCGTCRSPLESRFARSFEYYREHCDDDDFELQEKEYEIIVGIKNGYSEYLYGQSEKGDIAKQFGEYEYDVIAVNNASDGRVDIAALRSVMKKKSAEGWRLVSAYSNELGKDALVLLGFGANSTVCQDVLYFERRIK